MKKCFIKIISFVLCLALFIPIIPFEHFETRVYAENNAVPVTSDETMFALPDNMRGVELTPGKDFFASEMTEEELSEEISAIVSKLISWQMNTVLILSPSWTRTAPPLTRSACPSWVTSRWLCPKALPS